MHDLKSVPDAMPGCPCTGRIRSRLLDCFTGVVATHPQRVACSKEGSVLTYARLDQLSNDLAARMIAVAGERRCPVVLYLERSCEVPVACIAAAKAGVPYVPLDPVWPDERLRKIVARTGAGSFVCGPGRDAPPWLCDLLPGLRVTASEDGIQEAVPLGTSRDSLHDAAVPVEGGICRFVPGCDDDTPLYVLFTSGSTGEPKGVVVTHGNVVQLATSVPFPGFRAGRRMTLSISLGFDASVLELWGGLLNGCTLVCTPREALLDARRCREFLLTERIDYAVMSAAVFAALLGQDITVFGSLQKLITGGELLNAPLCAEMLEQAPPAEFYNSYGPTECTVLATWQRVETVVEGETIPAGLPLPTARVRIVDAELRPLPTGDWGEVLLGGAGVSAGYLYDPERTAAAFIPDPVDPEHTVYRTGDRGRLDAKGRLTLSGRLDDQVKIAGQRVEPGEIRAIVESAPGVRMAHVSYGPEYGLVAHVVPKGVFDETPGAAPHHNGHKDVSSARGQGVSGHASGRTLADASCDPLQILPQANMEEVRHLLRVYLARHLPVHMVPAHIIFVSALPLTTNGKVDAASLPAPVVDTPVTSGGMARLSSPLEDIEDEDGVLTAFREVLHNSAYGPDDTFLMCGGNSLAAATLLGMLHAQTGVWVPLEVFSGAETVRLVRLFIASARMCGTAPRDDVHDKVLDHVRL